MEKFYSFEDLGKLNGSKKEISENLTTDNNVGEEEIFEEVKEGDDVNLNSDELKAELEKEFDKEEEKIPYGFENKFFPPKASMKDSKNIFIKEGITKKPKRKAKNPNKKTAKAKAGRTEFRDAINR